MFRRDCGYINIMNFKCWLNESVEDMMGPYYHGTYHDFMRPKLGGYGIFWLTDNRRVALQYSSPYYAKGDKWLWTIYLKPGTSIIDLADVSNPIVNELREMLNPSLLHPISEEEWGGQADFGLLELKSWIIGFLKERGVDGVFVKDKLGTSPIPHKSLALFKLGKIARSEKEKVSEEELGGSGRTIGEIEKWVGE